MVNVSLASKAPLAWYKEPWPWILMGLPLAAVVAGFITLALAIRSNDGLVADDYYKQGLGINKVLARQDMAANMGLRADVGVSGQQVSVDLQGREGMAMPAQVRFYVSHPTREGEDEGVVLRKEGGRYVGVLSKAPAGPRNLIIEDEAKTWRLSASATLPSAQPVAIRPASVKPVG